MATVCIVDGTLCIDLSVPERVLSLHRGNVLLPLSDVHTVRVVPDPFLQLRGARHPGTGFPGVVAIGVWSGSEGGRRFHDFVLIDQPGPGVVIAARGEYDRLVIAYDDPQDFAAEVAILIRTTA